MPLLLITGYPSSGKTHRSNQLLQHFHHRQPSLQIHHITEDATLGLARNVTYATSRAEKDARAAFASAIKRLLAPNVLIIADAMNYIKGFRYQLHCEAKALQTPSCVVHVGTTAAQARDFNAKARRDGSGYEEEVFENLVFRYEEPNGMNRWDSPLFTIPTEDPAPPCDAIWDVLVGSAAGGKAKTVRPNAATVLKPAAEQDYLYELDRGTSEVVAAVMTWVGDHAGEGGGEVRVAGAGVVVLSATTPPSLPQLQRLRRQFIQLNRQHSLSKSRIRELFVDYLNDAFAG